MRTSNIAKANLAELLNSIRPDQPILAHRWVELREEISMLDAMRQLRPPRYRRKRWILGIVLLLLLLAWEFLKGQFELLALTALLGTIIWAALRFVRGPIDLNSIVLFYPDKATLLSDVKIERTTGSVSFQTRRDATPASLGPKFCISALNPFWSSGNFSFTLRGQWIILGRQTGIAWRRRTFQNAFDPEREITFSEMKQRLKAYIAED